MNRCLLGFFLLAGCAAPGPADPTVPPATFDSLPSLTEAERQMDPEAVLVAARTLIAGREADGALEHAVALLNHHQTHPPASVEVSTLLAEAHGRIADALDPHQERSAESHRAHCAAGESAARDALTMDPACGPAHYWRGRILLCLADAEQSYSRLREAREALEAADRLAPECDAAGPARYLGRIYQETPGWPLLGSMAKAVAWYERAVTLAPGDLRNRLWLGEAWAARKQPERAREQWEVVIAAPERPAQAKEDAALKAQARERLAGLGKE